VLHLQVRCPGQPLDKLYDRRPDRWRLPKMGSDALSLALDPQSTIRTGEGV
jgi:hypothetical protein